MARERSDLIAFNRGLVSRLALARVDLKRMAFSAQTMRNWMPRVLGSMMLRPGLQHIGSTNSNAAARFIPFIFATDDTALIEFTNGAMLVWVDDELIVRASVSTAVTNGTFDSNLSGWTDNDESGATSAWVSGGRMGLTGTGTLAAIRDQSVSVAVADRNVEHALAIDIRRGPVILRVGSTQGDDDYISETELQTGNHSLALTPTGAFHIRFMNRLNRQVLVDACTIEASGTMEIETPYDTGDLSSLRYDQSGDVVFIACAGFTQRRVERRATRSWSIVQYLPEDGPFRGENTGAITLTPSALSGNITVTASDDLFVSTMARSADNAGTLFRITSEGQRVDAAITVQDTWSDPIRVVGVGDSRKFTVKRTGTWVATVTLQRSLDSESGPWEDVTTYTTNDTVIFDDGLDNQIVWYRIGVATGDFTSGTVNLRLNYSLGSIDGIVRVTTFNSSTSVDAEVLSTLGKISASSVWAEGKWSRTRGWPSSVGFYEGRLAWAGKDAIDISVSDAFSSFDDTTEGDSGPISRTIGSGPVDTINWILPLNRMILGAQGAEFSARSTSFDEPLTPTNFNLKSVSTQGSSGVSAVKVDSRGMFVQRGGTRLFELAFNADTYDYQSSDLTQLIPEIGQPSITRIGVQRQPDTRIHCVRSDGLVACLVYDKAENVLCWLEIETDGDIEDVVILPGEDGDEEDRVYYVVNRTINGSTVRYLEKWATESECVGATLNKQADSFATFTNSTPAASVPAGTASHLIGESVVVWADGKCLRDSSGNIATFTVAADGGIAALTNAGSSYTATTGVVGLAYEAQYKTAKLGQSLTALKNIRHLGLVLADTHPRGLLVGPSLTDDDMDYLPLTYQGSPVDEDEVYEEYDDKPMEFPGQWDTDARVCLKAEAPRPVTVLGAIATGEAYA